MIKGSQPAIANTPVTPRWIYSNVTGSPRARRYYGSSPINLSTNLSATNFVGNGILTFLTTGGTETIQIDPSVYPNPSNGSFTFEPGVHSKLSELTLFDTRGRLVRNLKLNDGDRVISVTGLAPGTYSYRISGNGRKDFVTGKLIVTEYLYAVSGTLPFRQFRFSKIQVFRI